MNAVYGGVNWYSAYLYRYVDSIEKITLILADKSGLRKKPKAEKKKVDFDKVGGASTWWANMVKANTPKSDIDQLREEYNNGR